jgi:rod shape determining protein RodA
MYIGTVILLAVSHRWLRIMAQHAGSIPVIRSSLRDGKNCLILTLADFHPNMGRCKILAIGVASSRWASIWILLQPNLSTSIVMVVLWFAMLWASGLRLKHLGLFIAGGVLAPVVSFPFLVPYQQARVLNLLFPDPNARHGDIYNIQQALISIGSGAC